MIILIVCFVVFMILALFGGYAFRPRGEADYAPIGGWFFLWLCVAILGWVVFGGVTLPTATLR